MKKTNLATKMAALVLTVMMVFSLIPMMSANVSAAEKYFSTEILRLQKKFPDSKYWNGGNPDSYSSSPCSNHNNCNHCAGGKQCNGFAQKLSTEVFGSPSNDDKYWTKTFTKNYSTAANHIATAKPGDVLIFYHPHLVFVTAVTDTTITYADCNQGGTCNIRWNITATKSSLVTQFKGLEAIRHYTNYPGNIIFDNTSSSNSQMTETISTDWSNWSMISSNSNSSSLKITANTAWTAKPTVSWITLNTYSGSGSTTIVMYIEANTGAERKGSIEIKSASGNVIKTITINQPTGKVATTLTTDWSNWNMISPNSNSSSLKITTNTSWSASLNVAWITLNTYNGSGTSNIMIYIEANSGVARTGYVTIYAGELSKTITINQPAGTVAATITTDWSNWNMISPNSNNSSLKITTNTSWYAVSSVSWITLNTYNGSGSANIMMYIDANYGLARTGYITIYAGNAVKTITINQPKK